MSIRQCALDNAAYKKLKYYYDNRTAYVQEYRMTGKKVAGTMGCGVPEELLLAFDIASVPVCASGAKELKLSSEYLEYSFSPVAKVWFEKLINGTYKKELDYIVAADSEDVVNRLYYYLREIRRSIPELQVPEICMIDLLFSRHLMYQIWNERAYERFIDQLRAWTGRDLDPAKLDGAIALCNAQRQALREFDRLRTGEHVKVTGAEALTVIGAGFFMDKAEHTALVKDVTEAAASWPEVTGPRVFYTGSVQEDTAVYDAIEAAGAVVVGEDHNWGARYYQRDTSTDLPPVKAIVDKYMLTAVTTQKGLVRERVEALVSGVQTANARAVVFYNNEYEEAASWDYPSQKEKLEELGIPHINFVKMKYPAAENGELQDRLNGFVQSIGG